MSTQETAITREFSDAGVNVFLFVSEILGRRVLDADGSAVGKLADLKVKMGEMFPKICGLTIVKRKEKRPVVLGWNDVQSFNSTAIRLKPGAAANVRPLEVGHDEILLREELLDKQVVDTFGAKIERVNDIHLLLAQQELRVVHVDFGLRGILRRLGWLRRIDRLTQWLFAYQIEEKMISWKYIQPLLADGDMRNLKLNVAARKIHELHPSELADIIEELDRVNRSSVFQALDLQTAAQTLEEVEDPSLQASLIESASAEKVSDILEEMAPDEATDLLADMPKEKKEKLIRTLEKPSRDVIEALLKFKEGTAGSIMTKDFLAFPQDTSIGEAIDAFRKTTYPLECVSYIYVVNRDNRLIGVTTLRHLVIYDKETPLKKVMNAHLTKVGPQDDIEDVTLLFRKYKFLALPVVDQDNVLQGIITMKDIMQSRFEE